MKKFFVKVNVMVVILMIVLSALLSACDNGGTFNPDSGCIGQGAGFESCGDMLDSMHD